MLSLNATQQTIIASSEISASWLFTVTTAAPTTYRWSTKAKSFGGQSYTATILADSFGGISLNRSMSELSIQAPNTVVFSVTNSGNALSASDFEGASVLVQLVCSDGTNEAVIAQWKFRVKRCHAVYQRLEFICVDFVQEYLEGDYPDPPFIEGLAPSNDQAGKDGACVPVPFGTAYIPLRSVYVEADGARYYLLGPTG
ncbi:MAG: hypothetical protein M0R18_15620, partial [Deltaproteobacteria bacterium]|nr:hypothetical protein [Deltaproteobacteria bacterium]